jgi:transposase
MKLFRPPRLQRTIHMVCTDMWKAYINAVKEVPGQAMVVVNRFHVAKKYRDCWGHMSQLHLC